MTQIIPPALSLFKALRLSADKPARIALVGAGGKTSAMTLLAKEIAQTGRRVFLSTSTHLGTWQTGMAESHIVIEKSSQLSTATISSEEILLFTGPAVKGDRLSGLDSETLEVLLALSRQHQAWLLIEADGSRQRPLKAPGEHEPSIPPWVDRVVVTAGLSGLGQPLSETSSALHRAGQFIQLSGRKQGGLYIQPDDVTQVLCHPMGGLKGIPEGAQRWVLLNQVDTPELQAAALTMSHDLLDEYDGVVIADLQNHVIEVVCQRTACVILAAGLSTRLGKPKPLLLWRGKPLLRHAVETALVAGLDPVIVVGAADPYGEFDPALRAALDGLPVRMVPNSERQSGQSTSLRIGLTAALSASAPRAPGAVVFLLADQPFLTPEIIRALQDQHQHSLAPVIAPFTGGRRTNPVLFDQVTFGSLAALEGDVGGRAIFAQYPPQLLAWDDQRLLIDIDTPEDYQHLLEMDANGDA